MSIERQNRLDIILKCENNGDHAYSRREYVVHNLIVLMRVNVNKTCRRKEDIIINFFSFSRIRFNEFVCIVKKEKTIIIQVVAI
jgi:hypothetical protein